MAALSFYAGWLAGLFTTPAVIAGVFGGMWWWRRYRRSTADQGAAGLELVPLAPPAPPSPQDRPRINSISTRSVPGARRRVRGRRE